MAKSEQMEAIGLVEVKTEVRMTDEDGHPVVVEDVRAYKNPKTGKLYVSPADVLRAQYESTAKELGVEGRDISTLMLLYSKPQPYQEGYVNMLYRVNKMLFYDWQELREAGLEDALPHDEFAAEKRGPVPTHLKEDLRRLEKLGLVNVDWPEGEKRGSVSIKLTPRGETMARLLWNSTETEIKESILKWKRRLFLATPKQIMERVHKDYPEYRKQFTEVDES